MDNKNLHICFIVGTLGQGGAERQLSYISKELLEGGYQVSMVVLTKGEHYEEQLIKLGARIYNVQSKSRLKRFIEIGFIIKNAIKPTYIFSMHFYTNLYAVIANLFSSINYNGSSRNNLNKEIAANGKILGYMSYFFPERIIANSINSTYLSRNKRDFILTSYLPNKINLDKFKYYQRTFPSKTIKILNVGRLEKQKNQLQAIWLISELINNNINATLTFVGDGNLKEELKKEVESLGIEHKVIFLGRVNNVEKYYQNHDLLILTSLYEGTPNVVLEASASGLPVIASMNAGDARYLLPKENLYDGSNSDLLKSTLKFIESDHLFRYTFKFPKQKSIISLI